MKKTALFFILTALFSYSSNGQEAVISAEKMNILYMGVDNPVYIAAPNVLSDKLIVTIDQNSTIQKVSDGHYLVRVMQTGQFFISVEANGMVTKKAFRGKPLPEPNVSISGFKDGFIKLEHFKSAEGMIAGYIGFDFDARCSVQSYTVLMTAKGNDTKQMSVVGNVFTEEIKARFKTLKVGDIVSFFEIKVRCPGDPSSRNIGTLTYIMK